MRPSKHFLIAFMSMAFFIGTIGLVTLSDSQAVIKFKKAFPQAAVIKKFFSKTVCGHKNPKARFVTSKDGKEVCDRTTGNIWEQNPDSVSTSNPDGRMRMSQPDAVKFCADLGKKKKHGPQYQLPSIQQLASVLDYTKSNPALTPDVFDGVVNTFYWSASTIVGKDGFVWVVLLDSGSVDGSTFDTPRHVWCVRRDKTAHGF